MCFLFLYLLFSCKSLKRLGENIIQQTERNRKTTEQLEEKQKQQKYRISSPRTSANKSHKLFAEVRGLDILYFCVFILCVSLSFFVFLFMFLYVLLFVCFCFRFFLLCFRLVFLSFCIYNRKTHIKHKTQNIKTRRKT